jgi:hypothetical protein
MNDRRLNRRDLLGGALTAGALFGSRRTYGAPRPLFSAERVEDAIQVNAASGKTVLRYVRRRAPGDKSAGVEGACYTHPIYTPAGELVTDLATSAHLRGVFCSWVDVRGDRTGNWWGGGLKASGVERLIVNREATATDSGKRLALRVVNSWRAEGASVLEEVLTLTISAASGSRVLDYDYQFTPPTGTPVVLGQNPFGGFCYRAMPGGKLVITGPEGALELPGSLANKPQTNWRASPWYDLTYTTTDGTTAGVALIDHPKNPRSTWHVSRDLHMLNPCIVADAPHTLSSRTPLRLRYRLVAHDGPVQAAEIDQLVESFAR